MESDALDAADVARGRGRAYALLSELLLRGPVPGLVDAARASAGLARALSIYPDLDEAAADHHFVFSMSVPPYEGVFLDAHGAVGGPLTEELNDAYAAMGVALDPRGEGAEHLATELRALAILSASEAAALTEERVSDVDALRAGARSLMDRHLLRWLPSFAAAVRSAGRPLPNAIVVQIVDVVLEHRAELGAPDESDLDFALEGDVLDLDDDAVGVREIAVALSVPARAGLLIGRSEVARVGRRNRVPRGFGERKTLIHNLLRSAVSLGAFRSTVRELRALVSERRQSLQDARIDEVPGLSELVDPWLARLDETDAALTRMGRAGASSDPTPAAAP